MDSSKKPSTFRRLKNVALDATVIRSFDRRGYKRHAGQFNPQDLEADMTGRVCVVTGANSGLGYATSEALARLGATVWMLCRHPGRGEAAHHALTRTHPDADIHLALLDVSSLAAVEAFCENPPFDSIDVLIHNAGILPSERGASADGLDLTLTTNLVGPFALTSGLMPQLLKGERTRIIWVSSGGMYSRKLSIKRLEHPPEPFDGVRAYADTKRGMVVASEILADKLAPKGIAVHCMHPGWADTPGVKTSIPGFWERTQNILRNSAEGADTIVWLAVCDKAQHRPGLFWFDRAPRRTHLVPWTKTSQKKRRRFYSALHRWARLAEKAF
jgi:dehydrogenase/reductase SDR family protein 12